MTSTASRHMAKKMRAPVILNHNMLVKDVMQTDLITAKFDTSLVDTIAILKEKGISGLVVLDNIGEFVGVVSALDIFKAVNEGDRVENLVVDDVMTPFTITIFHDANIADAALTMMENNIHRLVVTESPTSKKPVGIVTSTDLINNLI
ncbi:MAG TPA: CBS domain-containing protein [Euryarchaeota archaeon]|nr:CBS domain-containing protein [Euryarchaeota archaeon]